MLLKIDQERKTSLYIQLYKQLKRAIIENRLTANSKLPPIRVIADELEINPATVVKAYNLLEREELIYKKVGSGSYVSPPGKPYILRGSNRSVLIEDTDEELTSGINFASATPTPDLFPVVDFKKVINRVLDRDGGESFVYQKSQGYYPLRESIQIYLHELGIDQEVKRIQVVSGAQQAIDLLARTLVDFDDRVIVEEPTYSGALSAFLNRGAHISSFPLEHDGIDLDSLENFLMAEDVSLIYIMTSFQNPTGITWSREKKEGLLRLASRYNFLIIEDDCLSDLYYRGKRPISLKSYDLEDRVIYIKSFSKVFMPGLRMAFMVLPENLIPAIQAAKYTADISCSGLSQRAFDLYLREGFLNTHIEKMRELFKRRFQLMERKINSFPSGIKLAFRPGGGLYFWLTLPDDFNLEKFYLLALKKGVAFLPGRLFSIKDKELPCFRLSFAAVDENEIEEGMDLLNQLLCQI